jgi:hypothetical protein
MGPHAVEAEVAHDPIQMSSLGLNRVAVEAEHVADLIEKFWRLTAGRARHTVPSAHDALKVLITVIGQNCPEILLLSHYQGEIAS